MRVVVVLVLMAFLACEGRTGPQYESATASCRQTATALCARAAECSSELFIHSYRTSERCVREMTIACEEQFLVRETLDAPPTCEAAARDAHCEDLTSELPFGHTFTRSLLAECPAPRGTRALGERCVLDSNCQSGSCGDQQRLCRDTCSIGCGVCLERAREGEPCGRQRCEDGLRCDKLTTGRCVRFRHLGEPCDQEHPCAGEGLSARCEAGTCIAIVYDLKVNTPVRAPVPIFECQL